MTLKLSGTRVDQRRNKMPHRLLFPVVLCLSLAGFVMPVNTSPIELSPICAAAVGISLIPGSLAKKLYGLARGSKFQAIGDFCFSIPEGGTGTMIAQTVCLTVSFIIEYLYFVKAFNHDVPSITLR